MGVRGWPAWFGLWSAGVVGCLAALSTPEALELGSDPPRPVDQVTATDAVIAAMPLLAGLLFPFVVGLLTWRRRPSVTRACLAVGAVGLAWAAVVFRGLPDVGPWFPWVVATAAVVAAVGALTGTAATGDPGSATAARLAAVALVAAGAVAVLLAWRGLDYEGWWWHPAVTGPMWAALAGGVLLVVLALLGRRLPDSRVTAALACLVLLGGALVALVWAGAWMLLDSPMLDRHEESESGWAKLPELVAGAGLLAGAVAAARRWWSTAAVSVVAGLLLAAGAVARDEMLWRLMW